MTRSWRRPFLVPVALILMGVLLLATNLGYLTAQTCRWVVRLWPILLILLGIELLVSGRASWGAGLFAFLSVMVAGGIGVGRAFFVPGALTPDARPGRAIASGASSFDQQLN